MLIRDCDEIIKNEKIYKNTYLIFFLNSFIISDLKFINKKDIIKSCSSIKK